MIPFHKPRYLQEANVACHFYRRFMEAIKPRKDIGIYMEYCHENIRFDCVLVWRQWIIAIFEFKKRNVSKADREKAYKKYWNFGVQTHLLAGIPAVDKFFDEEFCKTLKWYA